MYKFSFIILHYEAFNETVECVNSIEKNVNYDNYSIVIVDNNSPNRSGNLLKETYSSKRNVFVILNDENSGFAKGNNIGYEFAKKNLKADFVACINNDTIIRDSNFINSVIKLYDLNEFHIMGPDIITIDGIHQNPYKLRAINLNEIYDYIKNYRKNIIKDLLKMKIRSNKVLKNIYKMFNRSKTIIPNEYYKVEQENIVLHGAALIYSPLYIIEEDYAFYPDTFMYGEEQILYHICVIKGYKMIYNPITSIVHKEDGSTDYVLKNNAAKLKFIYKNELNSYMILKDILEKKIKV